MEELNVKDIMEEEMHLEEEEKIEVPMPSTYDNCIRAQRPDNRDAVKRARYIQNMVEDWIEYINKTDMRLYPEPFQDDLGHAIDSLIKVMNNEFNLGK